MSVRPLVDPKVVVFDLDDTLFPEHAYVRSGFAAVDRWLEKGGHLRGFRQRALELFEAGHRGNIFDLAVASLGVTAAGDLIPTLVRIYREHLPDLVLHPDADWALTKLAPGYRLAIITDGHLVAQQNKIRSLGLDQRVEAIVYSDQFGRDHWKPSATPYCKLVELLSCNHQDCVYVSDNPQKDFITARKLGWRTLQIARADGEYRHVEVSSEYQADCRITSLYDLPSVLTEHGGGIRNDG